MAWRQVMRRDGKPRSGVALGGIGTGSIELRADGCFYNWNIFNNQPWGTGPRFPVFGDAKQMFQEESLLFFVVRFQEKGCNPKLKLLQIEPADFAAVESPAYIYPWMTGVDRIDAEFSFPFVRLRYSDREMPLDIEMEAWSPFIPHDVKNSALPAAFFRFRVKSRSSRPVDVTILASLRNCVAADVRDKTYVTRILNEPEGRIVEMSCENMDAAHDSWGSMALASFSRAGTTHYAGWEHIHPYYEIVLRNPRLPDIDDTAGRNCKDRETGQVRAMERLWSTLGRSAVLRRKGQSLEQTFALTWHFPNLYAAQDAQIRTAGKATERRREGHYYATQFKSATEVARYVTRNRAALAERTRAFHEHFFDSSLPPFVLEQVNSHLNTFFTSSWLTKDFNFGIIEGLLAHDRRGPLSSIDVAMYGSVMTAALFPELDQSMIRSHARIANRESGSICHGIDMDFTTFDAREQRTNRLDLASNYVTQALRAFLWTLDRKYLEEVWPSVRAALEYVLRERDANGDLLPDMEGIMCTYDNFPMYGAASFVASLWLAALAYAVEAARVLGDTEAEARYGNCLRKGSEAFDRKLWNGRYYRLYNDEGGKQGGKDEACLTDQIIGQWAMHWAGMGELFPAAHIHKALRSIMGMCYRDYGLVNCRWPGDGWLHEIPKDIWVDQANTCWTGVELAFASLLIYEGLVREGLKVIRNVDSRYRKAGLYFDHQEFGGHYYRAMSAWAILNAFLGLSINQGRYRFAPRIAGNSVRLFFAFPGGTAHYAHNRQARKVSLAVHTGALTCRDLVFGGWPAARTGANLRLDGKAVAAERIKASSGNGDISLSFSPPLAVTAGQILRAKLG